MWWSSESANLPDGVPAPDQPRALELFAYQGCPYCARVERALARMPAVEVTRRDTMRDRSAFAKLRDTTGRTQVPCLFVDGEPLFESEDIVRWLEAHDRFLRSREGGKGQG